MVINGTVMKKEKVVFVAVSKNRRYQRINFASFVVELLF